VVEYEDHKLDLAHLNIHAASSDLQSAVKPEAYALRSLPATILAATAAHSRT
jgi:hypothetical protein